MTRLSNNKRTFAVVDRHTPLCPDDTTFLKSQRLYSQPKVGSTPNSSMVDNWPQEDNTISGKDDNNNSNKDYNNNTSQDYWIQDEEFNTTCILGKCSDSSLALEGNYSVDWMNISLIMVNGTNDTSATYIPFYQRPETYIVPVLFAIIFIVGVIGNGVLIAIFIRNKQLRNVPNTYIISLAIGDLIVLIFTVPFVSTVYTFDEWPYGEFECKFSEFFRDISVGVTVFTLTALSADRYQAIVSPIRKAVAGSSHHTLRVAVTIWLLSVLLATPGAVLTHVRSFWVTDEKRIGVCFPFPEHLPNWYPRANVLVKSLVYYFLPLVVITSFYILMAKHLLTSNDLPGESHPVFHKQLKTRRKVAKKVLCFVLIFAMCFLPNNIFMLWFYFHPRASEQYNDFWHSFRILGFCLTFINSCINPIALYCISGTFRYQYNRYLFCCCNRRQKKRPYVRASTLRSTSSGSRWTSSRRTTTESLPMTSLSNDRITLT